MMQMLAAAAATDDVWKARSAAAAAAACGVYPLAPPLNMLWPRNTPPSDLLSVVGGRPPPRHAVEPQFVATSPSDVGAHYRQLSRHRAVAALDDVKPPPCVDGRYRCGLSPPPPLSVDAPRRPFSVFRLVSDDRCPVFGAASSSPGRIRPRRRAITRRCRRALGNENRSLDVRPSAITGFHLITSRRRRQDVTLRRRRVVAPARY